MERNPYVLIGVGLLLLVLGLVLPMLMVLGYIESTIALNIIAHTSSVAGLFIGMIGISFYLAGKRRE